MRKINAKNRSDEAVRPAARFAGNVLCVLALLVFSALLAVPAVARPCCEDCFDWPEPPQFPDSCWRNCRVCGGGGMLTELRSGVEPGVGGGDGGVRFLITPDPGDLRVDLPAAGCTPQAAASGSGSWCNCWDEAASEARCEAYCADHGLGYCQASLPIFPGSCTGTNGCKMRVVNECYDNGVRTMFFFTHTTDDCESCEPGGEV